MVCWYVASAEAGAGKTTLCAGLGRYWLGKGRKVGFFRPSGGADEPDGMFMKRVLGLDEAVADICPVIDNEVGAVKEAYDRIASGKDVVITEGGLEPELIRALGARVIAVEAYSDKLPVKSVEAYKELGESLLGVVINKVPAKRLERVRAEVTELLEGTGIAVLALLPEDRVLLAPSVGELAAWLEGEILSSGERSNELVESLMVGALTVDAGPLYYGLKDNKAVVVRTERPDMQLAALETSTRCLVLCGGTAPTHAVLYEAEKKGAPVIQAPCDVSGAVSAIEEALGRSRFGQAGKLPRLAELMERYFDFDRVPLGN